MFNVVYFCLLSTNNGAVQRLIPFNHIQNKHDICVCSVHIYKQIHVYIEEIFAYLYLHTYVEIYIHSHVFISYFTKIYTYENVYKY